MAEMSATSIVTPGGASLIAAPSAARLWEAWRKLPQMPRIVMPGVCAMPSSFRPCRAEIIAFAKGCARADLPIRQDADAPRRRAESRPLTWRPYGLGHRAADGPWPAALLFQSRRGPMPAIDTVVFDIGNVLLDWNPRHLYRKIFADEARMEWFLANICTPAWNLEQDRGRPFASAVAELVGEHPQWHA